jgi:dTDP-4-amino-4,6-dideoxygalactose transaminase
MIDKLIYDRPRKSMFKWWIIHVPRIIILLRRITVKFLKFFLIIFRQINLLDADNKVAASNYQDNTSMLSYDHGIHMEPIIAALAQSQLRKIIRILERRQEILKKIKNIDSFLDPASKEFSLKSAYTYAIFYYPDKDIFEIIKKLRNFGILLRATWPTHQTIWKNQQTKNLKRFAEGILTWHVNPNSSKHELERFIKIANSIDK